MSTASTIIVDIARHQNWYIATSKSLSGLFVSDQSLAKLFQEIPDVIEMLMEEKWKCKVVVSEAPQPDGDVLPKVTYVAEEKKAA